MQKSPHIDPEKCTGCPVREMACSFENYATYAPGSPAHQGVRLSPHRAQGALHLHPVRRGLVPARLPGRGDHGRPPPAPRWSTRPPACRLQGCTIACPFGTINYVQETGKVQKCDLRRRPGLRQGLPDRRHHLRRRQLDRPTRWRLGRQARQPTRRGVRRSTNMSWAGKILRVNLSAGTVTRSPEHGLGAHYLGSRGLRHQSTWSRGRPQGRSASPDNKIIGPPAR